MIKIICLLPVLLLAACGDSNDNSASNSSGYTNGAFTATLGEIRLDVEVVCGNFNDEDAFFFNSDKTGFKDIDGDGILVAGSRVKIGKDKSPIAIDGMSLEITVNGESYSAQMTMPGKESVQTWTKTSNIVSGSDKLIKNGDLSGTEYPINYEVTCK